MIAAQNRRKGGDMAVVKWSPFQELESMERRMRRLFEDAGMPSPAPAADVYETDGAFVIELEVPGFEEKELDVEVIDHTLTITGERKEEKETKEKTFFLQERLEKQFERRFQLPAETKAESVTASFAKGVLEVRVPKTPEPSPRKISIGATK
jgi:HSP20 family protein